MTWWAIDVRAAPEVRDTLAAWLVQRTGQAVEERADGTLVSFAFDVSAAEELIQAITAAHGPRVSTSRREVADEDWGSKWREGLGPRSFGRLTVVPSWIPYRPGEDEIVVVVDPESAFGTGEHGSTRAALQLLVELVKPGDFVLDLGSGSGILSIAAVKLGAARAVGIEQDADAVEVAERNTARNGVADRVTFFEGDVGQMVPLFAPVDLALSNILRSVNLAVLPEVHRAVRPGGIAVFSGMESADARDFRSPVRAAGFTILSEFEDAGWWAVAARRR